MEYKEKIIIKAKIKDEDGTIKEISQEVEIDLIKEENQYFTKEGGEPVILEKDGKQYPVMVNVSIEKSMTSVAYLPGKKSHGIEVQPNQKWKIKSQKLEFPNASRGFSLLILLIVVSLVIIASIVGIVIWKKKKRR